MTPEQMIEAKSGTDFRQNHPVLDTLDFGDVRDLMEDYARQEAIGFAEWKEKNYYIKQDGEGGKWFDYVIAGRGGDPPEYTLNELFEMWNRDKSSRVG